MCHRYRFKLTVEAAIEKFGIDYVDYQWLDTPDYYPAKPVPAIRSSEKHERELVELQWGLLPRWWDPKKHKSQSWFHSNCYNAKSETVHELNSYREPFKARRCLLLATEFFEYGSFFHRKDHEPFAIAGIWESWRGEEGIVETCSMLTTEANSHVAAVHPKKRMPVMLEDEPAIKLWMSPDITERQQLEALFQPYPDSLLETYVEPSIVKPSPQRRLFDD